MAAYATTGGRWWQTIVPHCTYGVDMPSRRADAEYTYAAAEEWVNRALRSQDSLFTPGKAIWTAELLSELRARFLDHPDDTKDPFYTKVRRQLAGSEPEVFQLMAEAFYFVSLIVWHGQFRAATKLDRIKGLLLEDVEIPSHLVKGLDPGMAGIGPGFASGLPYYVGYIIEFADKWKESEPTELLDDPWGFKEFALGIDLKEGLFGNNTTHHITQRHALLHLVFSWHVRINCFHESQEHDRQSFLKLRERAFL